MQQPLSFGIPSNKSPSLHHPPARGLLASRPAPVCQLNPYFGGFYIWIGATIERRAAVDRLYGTRRFGAGALSDKGSLKTAKALDEVNDAGLRVHGPEVKEGGFGTALLGTHLCDVPN